MRNFILLAPAFIVNGLQCVIEEILVNNKFAFACSHTYVYPEKADGHLQLGGRKIIMYLYDKLQLINATWLTSILQPQRQLQSIQSAKKMEKKILCLRQVWIASTSEATIICLWIFYKQRDKQNFPDKWLTVNYLLSSVLPPTLMNSNIVNPNIQYNESKYSPLVSCEWHNCFILLFTKCQSFILTLDHSIEVRCAVNGIPVMSSC